MLTIIAVAAALHLQAATQEELNAALHAAIPGGDVAAVSAALAAGAEINAPDADGWPALQSAVEFNKIAIVDVLLAAGAAVDARDSTQGTALHLAVFWGWADIAKALLGHRADPNARDVNGDTPLFRLSDQAPAIGAELVAAGVDVNAANNSGATALHGIANEGRLEALKFLLAHGADLRLKDHEGHSPADRAIGGEQPETLALLLAAKGGKASVTAIDAQGERGRTRLHQAAFDGNIALATCLITAGAAIEAREDKGATPLFFAVAKGHGEIVTLLLDNGADVNAQLKSGMTAVDVATNAKQEEILEVLKARGGRDGRTIVFTRMREAMVANDAAAVGGIMDEFPDLAKVNDLLTSAADSCSPEVIKVLLEKGCSANSASATGWTALHTAAARNDLEIVLLLLAHNADPNIEESKEHWTALDVAVFEEHKEVADAIRAAGGTGGLDEAQKLLKDLKAKKKGDGQ